MEDDQEDVKLISTVLSKNSQYDENFRLEFDEFVDFDDPDSESDYQDSTIEDNVIDSKRGILPSVPSRHQQEIILTDEERKIIDSCLDPDLKQLLILNRKKNWQLLQLQKKVQDIIVQCEARIKAKEAYLNDHKSFRRTSIPHLWKLAAPYFKDEKCFPSPLNADATKRRAIGLLSIADLPVFPKWTPIEFDRLVNGVKCLYSVHQQGIVTKKMKQLKIDLADEDFDEQEKKGFRKELKELTQELEALKTNDDVMPPADFDDHINWFKIADVYVRDRHTVVECQVVWKMLLHPSLNKSEWSKSENQELQRIVKENSYQDWKKIATQLNTNRSEFTVCVHYFSKLYNKYKKAKFTPEEDQLILDLINEFRIGTYIPWNEIERYFETRARHQLYHRYKYFLSQDHVKRGKFTEAEDILLVILVQRFGKNFSKCVEYMPHRSMVQMKCRYNNNLKRQIKKGTFTVEDDKKIMEYVKKNGEKSWSNLTKDLKRSCGQLRQRYKIIKNFLESNPEMDISHAPKRKHGYDMSTDERYQFLEYIVEQYKDIDYIPTLAMIEDSLQVEWKTPLTQRVIKEKPPLGELKWLATNVKNIDAMIVDVFAKSEESDKPAEVDKNILEAVDSATNILQVLDAQLTIPDKFDCNIHLDRTDCAILEKLSKVVAYASQSSDLLPPNLATLMGLKNLIIKHQEFKSIQDSKSTSTTVVNPDREVFSKRFNSLFHWPAVLSIERPNETLCPIAKLFVDQNKTKPLQLMSEKRRKPQNHRPFRAKRTKINVISVETVCEPTMSSQVEETNDEEDVKHLNVALNCIKSEGECHTVNIKTEHMDDEYQ